MEDDAVDKERVEKLKLMLAENYPRMVQNFLHNTKTYIDDVASALTAGDRTAAMATAHKMTSSCGQFGLIELQRLAKSIEHSEGLDNDMLLARVAELKPALGEATEFLHAHGLAA